MPHQQVAQALAQYQSMGFAVSAPSFETSSQDYGACFFYLNEQLVRLRVGKVTPIKIGCFITLWYRNPQGTLTAYAQTDPFSHLVVLVGSTSQHGQWIFPKKTLIEKKIIASDHSPGKAAFRLYPNWEPALNPQAIRTQSWQRNYFIETTNKAQVSLQQMQAMFLPVA